MERLENGYSKNLKKKAMHLLKIVEILEKEQKASKKLNRIERIKRSISHKIYPFSNEYLTQYLTGLNLKHKNVMVVGSSGDQALSSAFLGAREVLLLDANPLTKPFFDLKLAALKNLDYNTFINFFNLKSEDALSVQTYEIIKKDLPLESSLFWEIVLEKYSFKKIRNIMFQHLKIFNEKDIPYLLCEETYDILKQNLDNVKFEVHTANISKFHIFAKQKNYYALIMLSNISDYITRYDFKDSVRNLLPFLTDDGVMQVAYEFTGTDFDYSYLNGVNYFRVEEPNNKYSVVFLKKQKQNHKTDENGKKIYKSPYEIGIETVPNTSIKEY